MTTKSPFNNIESTMRYNDYYSPEPQGAGSDVVTSIIRPFVPNAKFKDINTGYGRLFTRTQDYDHQGYGDGSVYNTLAFDSNNMDPQHHYLIIYSNRRNRRYCRYLVIKR